MEFKSSILNKSDQFFLNFNTIFLKNDKQHCGLFRFQIIWVSWLWLLILNSDKPYSMLKPGQKSISRTYYDKVTHEKPNGDGVLKNYNRFQSNYDQS